MASCSCLALYNGILYPVAIQTKKWKPSFTFIFMHFILDLFPAIYPFYLQFPSNSSSSRSSSVQIHPGSWQASAWSWCCRRPPLRPSIYKGKRRSPDLSPKETGEKRNSSTISISFPIARWWILALWRVPCHVCTFCSSCSAATRKLQSSIR